MYYSQDSLYRAGNTDSYQYNYQKETSSNTRYIPLLTRFSNLQMHSYLLTLSIITPFLTHYQFIIHRDSGIPSLGNIYSKMIDAEIDQATLLSSNIRSSEATTKLRESRAWLHSSAANRSESMNFEEMESIVWFKHQVRRFYQDRGILLSFKLLTHTLTHSYPLFI